MLLKTKPGLWWHRHIVSLTFRVGRGVAGLLTWCTGQCSICTGYICVVDGESRCAGSIYRSQEYRAWYNPLGHKGARGGDIKIQIYMLIYMDSNIK